MSKNFKISFLLHIIAFSTYGYAIYWQEKHLKPYPWDTPQSSYAGKWKNLTHWNLVIQFCFFGLSCLYDLFTYNKIRRINKYKRILDNLFHGVVFPLATLVSGMFWLLYLIDRELVFSKNQDNYIPSWLNHINHTWIFPFVILESYFCYHKIPKNKVGLSILYGLVMAYFVWTFYLAMIIGHWVYPIMRHMSWTGRLSFISFNATLFTIFYFIGSKLHKSFWSNKKIFK